MRTNEHRPDEKGIATRDRQDRQDKKKNEHRPDEKGIATPLRGGYSNTHVENEHRPDEKGIATAAGGLHVVRPLRTNTDLMKKGLRPEFLPSNTLSRIERTQT